MHAVVLKYFEEVARRGSIRKASRALNVASSAVNRQILKLEDELGTPLFERLPTGLVLTPAGELLLRHVRSTISEFDRFRSELAALDGTMAGVVAIACLDSLLIEFLPGILAAFSRRYPAVQFQVFAHGPAEIPQLLAAGQAEIGLTFTGQSAAAPPWPELAERRGQPRPPPRSGVANLAVLAEIPCPLGVIMPPSHPLAERRMLTLADCVHYPLIFPHDTQPLQHAMFAELHATRAMVKPILVCNQLALIKRMVAVNLGLAFYTRIAFLAEIARGELVHVPLTETSLASLKLGLVVPRDRRPTAAVAAMTEHLRRGLLSLAL